MKGVLSTTRESLSERVNRRTGTDKAMRVVAIVWTELHQVFLMALLRQENYPLDVLFMRDGIRPIKPLVQQAGKLVKLPSLSYSVKSQPEYRYAFRDLIDTALDGIGSYRLLSWSMESPFSRHIAQLSQCVSAGLFEDGTGSYLGAGRWGWRYGWKHVPTKLLLQLMLWPRSVLRPFSGSSTIEGWSLFPGAFRGLGLQEEHRLQSHQFRLAIRSASAGDQPSPILQNGATIYLPSPFSDCNLMTFANESEIHIAAVSAVRRHWGESVNRVLWKSHPRADPLREVERMDEVGRATGVEILPLKSPLSIEQILLANEGNNVRVASVASSALYTLKALNLRGTKLVLVPSPRLERRVSHTVGLQKFLEEIGIEAIG